MAETYQFDEMLIKTGGTLETRIDTYCKDVNVSLRRTFLDMKNEAGKILKRAEAGREAEMSIGVVFANEINLSDGSNLKVYFANSVGSTVYQLGTCYISEKGWKSSENDSVIHDVKMVGADFGTV